MEQILKQKKLNRWLQNKRHKAQYILRRSSNLISLLDCDLSPFKPLSQVYLQCQAVSTFCHFAKNAESPSLLKLAPHIKQSFLANLYQDLFAANSDKKSPQSRVIDANIRAILAPN